MGNEISCIIQARMGSSRLSGKVLMSLDGKNSVLYYTLNQLKHSKLIDRIIIFSFDQISVKDFLL